MFLKNFKKKSLFTSIIRKNTLLKKIILFVLEKNLWNANRTLREGTLVGRSKDLGHPLCGEFRGNPGVTGEE